MALVLLSGNAAIFLFPKEGRPFDTTCERPPEHPAVRFLSDQRPGLWIFRIVDCQPLLPLVAVCCPGFIRKQDLFPIFWARPQCQLLVCEGESVCLMSICEIDPPWSDDPFVPERSQGRCDRAFAKELKPRDIVPQIGPWELPVHRVGIKELNEVVLFGGLNRRLPAATVPARGQRPCQGILDLMECLARGLGYRKVVPFCVVTQGSDLELLVASEGC